MRNGRGVRAGLLLGLWPAVQPGTIFTSVVLDPIQITPGMREQRQRVGKHRLLFVAERNISRHAPNFEIQDRSCMRASELINVSNAANRVRISSKGRGVPMNMLSIAA